MKDYLGHEIKVGDIVLTNDIHYKSFTKGIVVKITNKLIEIKIEESVSRHSSGVTRRHPLQAVVVTDLIKEEEQ